MNLNNFKEKINYLLNKKQNILFILGILLIAVIWRILKINTIPKGLNFSEITLVNNLIDLTKNGWKLKPENISQTIYYYLFAGFGYLVRFKIIYLRLLQSLIGIGSVMLFYSFVRNWFNRQTALLSTLLLATSFFHVFYSRILSPVIFIPIIILGTLYLFTLSLRTNNFLYFILTGLTLGLSLYIDKIFILLPVVGIFIYIYLLKKGTKVLKGYKKGIITTTIISLLVSLPSIIIQFKTSNVFSYFNPGSIGKYYLNLGNNIQTLFYQSDLNLITNLGTEPVLDPFITISFIAGLVYALFYIRRRKFLILLNLFLGSIFIISLISGQRFDNFIFVLPSIYIISAIMLDYVLTHWVRTFPYNKPARLLMTFVFSLFLFLSIFYNYQKYFWAWGTNEKIQENYQYKIEYTR